MIPNSPARVNKSVSHPLEKPALIWLANRLPDWVSSDDLTILGFLGAMLAFASCMLTSRNLGYLWLANVGIFINWFGDSLDGTLARVRCQERPNYGFFVDHSTDVLSQLLIGLGMGLTPFIRFDVACLAVVAYLALMALTFIRERAFGTMQISFGILGPTEARLAVIGLNIWMFFGHPHTFWIFHGHFTVLDLIIAGASIAVFFVLPFSIMFEARRFVDETADRQEKFNGQFRAASLPAGMRDLRDRPRK